MRKKSTERFNEIIRVFAFYGFEIMIDSKLNGHKRSPKDLRKACEELGPTFIKIGQMLSTRTDILPREYTSELKKLQDSVQEEKFEAIKQVFEESLNKNIEECFIKLNKKPIASASVAQVYEGILNNGRDVVVKIQRPNIYEKMKVDISILKRILKFTKLKDHIKVVDVVAVLDEIEDSIEKELNFKIEGNNIKVFKEKSLEVTPLYVPELIEELWSNKVLTLEKINGFKINDIEKIKNEGYDTKDVARKLALCYCKQIFDDGFFHGDPHPGNILIYNGKICFLDFGIMGKISDDLRGALNDAIFAVATKDKEKLIEFILSVGIQRGRVDKGKLYEDVSYMFDSYITTSLRNIKISTLFQEIFEIVRENNIQFPKELTSLVRGLVILEGVMVEVDPEVDILSLVISFISSRNKSDIFKDLTKEEIILKLYEIIRDSTRIPSKTLQVLNNIESGRAKLNLEIKDLDKTISNIHTMVNRLTGGLLVSALIISSSLIVRDNTGPAYNGISVIGIVGYIIAFILTLVLLISMIRAGEFKHKKK